MNKTFLIMLCGLVFIISAGQAQLTNWGKVDKPKEPNIQQVEYSNRLVILGSGFFGSGSYSLNGAKKPLGFGGGFARRISDCPEATGPAQDYKTMRRASFIFQLMALAAIGVGIHKLSNRLGGSIEEHPVYKDGILVYEREKNKRSYTFLIAGVSFGGLSLAFDMLGISNARQAAAAFNDCH
jgi:hypothetical protein